MTFASARPRLVIVLLALFALVNSTVWSLTVTEGIAPDEQAHFAVAQHIAYKHEIPEFGSKGFEVFILDISGRDGSRLAYPYLPYASQPPLPYVLAAPFIAMPTHSVWMDYRQARIPQAFLASAFVIVLYLGLLAMFPGRTALAISGAVWGSMWPQITYLSAYLNADLATTVACAALIGFWFVGTRNGWSKRDALILGLLMGIAASCKLNAYLVIATSLVIAALTLRGSLGRIASRLGLAAGAFVVSVSWWVAIAVSRYGVDIFARKRGEKLAHALGATASKLDGASSGWTYWHLLSSTGYKRNISLTGILGMPNHFPSPGVKALVSSVVATCVLGLLVATVRRIVQRSETSWWSRLRQDPTMRVHAVLVLLFPVFLFSISYNAFKHDIYFLAQGRYLFPMFLPFVAFLTYGAAALWKRAEVMILGAIALVMVAANVVALERDAVLYYGRNLHSWFGYWEGYVIALWGGLLALVLATVFRFFMLAQRPGRPTSNEPLAPDRLGPIDHVKTVQSA